MVAQTEKIKEVVKKLVEENVVAEKKIMEDKDFVKGFAELIKILEKFKSSKIKTMSFKVVTINMHKEFKCYMQVEYYKKKFFLPFWLHTNGIRIFERVAEILGLNVEQEEERLNRLPIGVNPQYNIWKIRLIKV